MQTESRITWKQQSWWCWFLPQNYFLCRITWKQLIWFSGMTNKKEGYENIVAAAIMISKKFDTKSQQDLVIKSLQEAFPLAILTMASWLPTAILIPNMENQSVPECVLSISSLAHIHTIWFRLWSSCINDPCLTHTLHSYDHKKILNSAKACTAVEVKSFSYNMPTRNIG